MEIFGISRKKNLPMKSQSKYPLVEKEKDSRMEMGADCHILYWNLENKYIEATIQIF